MTKRNINGRFDFLAVFAILALIIIAVAIGVPYFVRSHNLPAMPTCMYNLLLIDAAKERAAEARTWAVDRPTDDPDSKVHVNRHIKGKRTPECPAQGVYRYNPIGKEPTCSAFDPDDEMRDAHRMPSDKSGYYRAYDL